MNLKTIRALLRYNKEQEDIDFDFYRDFEMLSGLKDSEIRKLHDYFINKTYRKGEIIFRENHPSAVIYIIKHGKVRLYMNFPNNEVIVRLVEEKKHFGEIGIFIEANRVTSAIAVVDSELIAIKKSDFISFINNNPSTGIKLMYNLGRTVSNELVNALKTIWGYETE